MGDEKVRRIQLLRSGCFSKQQAVESYSSDDNPVEYASGRMSETASRVLHKSPDGAATAGRQGAKATKNVLKKVVISFARAARAAVEAIKASDATIAAAGSTAVIIIIVCVLFCTVFCVFEDSSGGIQVYSEEELLSFEEGVGIGSTDIVKVASTQIGNWNGRKFWSWYDFGSRQPWCACFVSWCANQCGYIKAGVIPKFALVTDGISWFKKKGEWRSRKYKPRPGDIIFFDWYGDGSRDHVGIVESCDGRYVHTIEGNSSNLCRRKTYPVGWYEIYGYGVPKYPGPKEKKSEKKAESEKTDKK